MLPFTATAYLFQMDASCGTVCRIIKHASFKLVRGTDNDSLLELPAQSLDINQMEQLLEEEWEVSRMNVWLTNLHKLYDAIKSAWAKIQKGLFPAPSMQCPCSEEFRMFCGKRGSYPLLDYLTKLHCVHVHIVVVFKMQTMTSKTLNNSLYIPPVNTGTCCMVP